MFSALKDLIDANPSSGLGIVSEYDPSTALLSTEWSNTSYTWAFPPRSDGAYLYGITVDGRVRKVNRSTGVVEASSGDYSPASGSAVCCDGDMVFLAVGTSGSIYGLDASDLSEVWGPVDHGDVVYDMYSDGAFLFITGAEVAADSDNTTRKMSRSAGTVVASHARGADGKGICSDGTWIYVVGDRTAGNVVISKHLYDLTVYYQYTDSHRDYNAVAVSDDLIFVGRNSETSHLSSLAAFVKEGIYAGGPTPSVVWEIPTNEDRDMVSVAFDGRWLYAGSTNGAISGKQGQVNIFDPQSGREIARVTVSGTSSAALGADGMGLFVTVSSNLYRLNIQAPPALCAVQSATDQYRRPLHTLAKVL